MSQVLGFLVLAGVAALLLARRVRVLRETWDAEDHGFRQPEPDDLALGWLALRNLGARTVEFVDRRWPRFGNDPVLRIKFAWEAATPPRITAPIDEATTARRDACSR